MKVESFAFGVTWVLMNALLVMLAVEPLSQMSGPPAAPVADIHSIAPAPSA